MNEENKVDLKVYDIAGLRIYVTRGIKDDQRRFYSEVHKDRGEYGYGYQGSYGSNARTHLLAALSTLVRYWAGRV